MGTGLFPALLLAGFFNVALLAIAAPLGGRLLRRRRPDLPKVVADDRVGTAALVVLAVALLAGGLIHRPAVLDARRAFTAQSVAVRHYVAARAPGRVPPEHRSRGYLADRRRPLPHLCPR